MMRVVRWGVAPRRGPVVSVSVYVGVTDMPGSLRVRDLTIVLIVAGTLRNTTGALPAAGSDRKKKITSVSNSHHLH